MPPKQTDLSACLAKCVEGDRAAQEELVQAVQDRVYRHCLKMLQHEQDAMDAAQDVLIAMLSSLPSLREPDAFDRWLLQIARNVCCKRLSRYKRARRLMELEASIMEVHSQELDDQTIPDHVLDTEENRRIVSQLVDALPESQRMCVMMYYYQDQTVREISDALSVSEGTVKSRLHYARTAIRKGVEQYTEQGFTLYGVSPLPFLRYFLQMEAPGPVLSAAAGKALTEAVLAGAAAGAAVGAGAAKGFLSTWMGRGALLAACAALATVIAGTVLPRLQPVPPEPVSPPALQQERPAPPEPPEIFPTPEDASPVPEPVPEPVPAPEPAAQPSAPVSRAEERTPDSPRPAPPPVTPEPLPSPQIPAVETPDPVPAPEPTPVDVVIPLPGPDLVPDPFPELVPNPAPVPEPEPEPEPVPEPEPEPPQEEPGYTPPGGWSEYEPPTPIDPTPVEPEPEVINQVLSDYGYQSGYGYSDYFASEWDGELPEELVYSSSAPEIVAINDEGRFSTLAPGTAVLTAEDPSDASKKYTLTITVKDELDWTCYYFDAILNVGDSKSWLYESYVHNGKKDLLGAEYTSSDPSIVTAEKVINSDACLLTAIAPGKTTITARLHFSVDTVVGDRDMDAVVTFVADVRDEDTWYYEYVLNLPLDGKPHALPMLANMKYDSVECEFPTGAPVLTVDGTALTGLAEGVAFVYYYRDIGEEEPIMVANLYINVFKPPEPDPEPEPTPDPEPEPSPEPDPAPAPEPEPEPDPAPDPEPEPEPPSEPDPGIPPEPEPEPGQE